MSEASADFQHAPQQIDFDEWAHLAKTDPDAFEARRRSVIEQAINRVPEERRQRLRGLQFQIDMERRRARTPLAACIRLSAMMWDSVLGPDGLQQRLQELSGLLQRISAEGTSRTTAQTSIQTAKVVQLSSRRKR